MKTLFLITPWSDKGFRQGFMINDNKVVKLVLGKNWGWIGVSPPVGIMYLSSILKKAGHETFLIDGYFCDINYIFDKIESIKPDLIGIQSHTRNWASDKKYISLIKKRFPEIKIVLGGAHARDFKRECMKGCPELDFLIYQEADNVISDFCKAVEGKIPFSCVKGLIWRKNGKIIRNKRISIVKDLDKLPFPDYTLIDVKKYIPTKNRMNGLPTTSIIDSRDCTFHCRFCDSRKRFRIRSPKNVISEIRFLMERYNVKDFMFFSNVFFNPREFAERFCKEVIKQNLDITWSANGRANLVDFEMLQSMHRAGCRRLHYGIESGSQKTLDYINKQITLQQVRDAVRLTRKAKIEILGFFIFGFPGETYEDALKTIDFATSLDLDYVNFCPLTFYKKLKYFGYTDSTKNLRIGDLCDEKRKKQGIMTSRELNSLEKIALRSFYLRSSYVIKRLYRMRRWDDARKNLIGIVCLLDSFFEKRGRIIT